MMIVETPTPNLQQSLSFYKKLNFEVIEKNDNAVVTDGSVKILINNERTTRPGIKLYIENIDTVIKELQEHVVFYGPGKNMFSDLSGMRTSLFEKKNATNFKAGKTDPSLLGSFAGVSIETPDMEGSMKVWKILGFEVSMGGVEQGWIALSNAEGHTISMMNPMSCPHLFFSPSLTYFNGANNLSIIEGIKNAGVEITEEITHFNSEGLVDNIIIRDPGGFGFFVFSD